MAAVEMLEYDSLCVSEVSDDVWAKMEHKIGNKWVEMLTACSTRSSRDTTCKGCFKFEDRSVFEGREQRIKSILCDWKLDSWNRPATIGDMKHLLYDMGLAPALLEIEEFCETGQIVDAQSVLQTILPGFPVPQQQQFLEDRQELGRIEEEFSDLRRAHASGVIAVFVTGSPASGKTQLCRMYAKNWFSDKAINALEPDQKGLFLPVLLLDASSEANLQKSLLESLHIVRTKAFVTKIIREIQHTNEHSVRICRYLKELKKRLGEKHNCRNAAGEWLVVVDGAFDDSRKSPLMHVVKELLFQDSDECGCGRLLVTMQSRSRLTQTEEWLAGKCTELQLQVGFSPDDSLRFLGMCFPNDSEQDLMLVAERMFHVPYLLAAMAFTMKNFRKQNPVSTWEGALDDCEGVADFDNDFYSKPASYGKSYSKALECSVRKFLKHQHEPRLHEQLFFLLGVCAPGGLLMSVVKHYILEQETYEVAFLQFKKEISNHFLLTSSQVSGFHGSESILVHDTLHAVLKDRAVEKLKHEQVHELSRVVNALCSVFKDGQASYAIEIQTKLHILPHIEAVNSILEKLDSKIEPAKQVQLYLHVSEIQTMKGDREGARKTLREGMNLLNKIDKSSQAPFKSSFGKEMVQAHDMDAAIEVLKENIAWRNIQIEKLVRKRQTECEKRHKLKSWESNDFLWLCEDLVNIGYAYKDRGEKGDIREALRFAEECESVLKQWKTFDSSPSTEDQIMDSRSRYIFLRAQIYQDQGKHECAAHHLRDLLCKHKGRTHFIAQVKRMYTDMLLEPDKSLRNLEQAKKQIQEAVEISKSLYGDEPRPLTAYCLMTLGHFWTEYGSRSNGGYKKALQALQEAQDMSNSIPAPVRPKALTALVMYFRGECLLKQGCVQEACEQFEECRVVTKSEVHGFGPGHPQNCYVLDKIGLIYTQLNQPEQAIEWLHEAVRIKLDNFGTLSDKLLPTYERLETACYDCDRDEDALEFRQKRLKLYDSQLSSSGDQL